MNFPLQQPSRAGSASISPINRFDMRDYLEPKRMTVIMWDTAFLTRHMKGDSFEDYDRVINEAIERGYNTLRIDPIPQVIDLSKPEKIIARPPLMPNCDFFPWERPGAFEGPAGEWLIEFMEIILAKNLYYALSAWSGVYPGGIIPKNLLELTECWKKFLMNWRERFGFNNCLYVDLSNEYPYFLNGHFEKTIADFNGRWTSEYNAFTKCEVNSCLKVLRREFPEVRFTVSLHGDVNWIDLDLELDVMDIHFYSDADPRFIDRTLFDEYMENFFITDSFFKDFSDRCLKSHKIMAPMYRARQRSKVAAFSSWAEESGIPLLTTESWASWYYIDHKDLDWSWLLDWAQWSVDDAIDYRMWGWTPHNYCQPQFKNWYDIKWHQRLTEKFLNS